MIHRIPDYWRNLPVYLQLKGSVCKKCGAKYFPPRKICPKCGSRELEVYDLPRRGKLLSWTIIRYPAKEFEKFSPYVVGLIELEDGVRLIAQITDVKEDELKFGMELRATVRRAFEEGEDGIVRYTYKFVPI